MTGLLTKDKKEILLAVWSRKKGLSGNCLKLIACILMFFDHLSQGVALQSVGFTPTYGGPFFDASAWAGFPNAEMLATVAVFFGRIAFPIFCFFLVQGILLTRDYKKQILRLLLFALIAEVPFDLGLFGQVFYGEHQNVLFTLALGAATIVAMKYVQDGEKGKWSKLSAALIFVAAAAVAEFLKFDYGAFGITAMVLFYLVSANRRGTMLAGLVAFLFEAPYYGTVYLSLPLIYLYNGKRGRGGRWFFYIFYPAHLLALYLLSLFL